MDESSSGRNVSTAAEPAADNDQDSDLATILQFLIRRYDPNQTPGSSDQNLIFFQWPDSHNHC